MKRENQRFLAFILVFTLIFSTLVYGLDENLISSDSEAEEYTVLDETANEEDEIQAEENEDQALQSEEDEILQAEENEDQALQSEDQILQNDENETPAEEDKEDDSEQGISLLSAEADEPMPIASSLNPLYEIGDAIDFGTENLNITVMQKLTGDGTYVQGSSTNSNYQTPSGETISCRIVFKVEPAVTGNITVKSNAASGKQGYILKDTGTDGTYDILLYDDKSPATMVGFLEAGSIYYICYKGTNAKISEITFEPGNEPITESESETETTTEEETNIENINDIARTAPSKASDGKKHTIWVLGDSTACYYGADSGYSIPRNGFGMALGDDSANGYEAQYKIFDNPNIEVKNLAISGISSLSFLSNANYKTLTENWQEGDYLILAFGHNDQKEEPARFTNASKGAEGYNWTGQFAYSLYSNYILPAVKKGVTPILATSIVRRSTSANGPSGSNVHDLTSKGFGDYRQTVIDLGKKFNLSVLDNTYYTYSECIALGAGADEIMRLRLTEA